MRTRVLAVTVVALSLAACAPSQGEQVQGGSTPATGGSRTATPSASHATPTRSPTMTPSPLLAEGRNFGFIHSVDATGAPATVVFDLAYFLTGNAATRAAKQHGDEYPPPNDYYIVNDNPRLRTLPLAPDVRIVLLDWNHCCDVTFRGDLTAFATAIDDGEFTVGGKKYQGRLSPYWLVVQGGIVVRIEEQFLP